MNDITPTDLGFNVKVEHFGLIYFEYIYQTQCLWFY